MKTIKIKFCDWYNGFDLKDNWITHILSNFYELQFCDDPEYIFFSVWGTEHLKYDCIKIFYTAEDISPDFNLCDYAIGFDNINYNDRYLRFSYLVADERLTLSMKKHIFTDEEIREKTKFCNYIVSNGRSDPIRTDIFNKLSAYKKVDSGGRYLNNIGGPVNDKRAFQADYKFSVAFENGAQPGYTTEKIMDAFAAKTIPIYWGNPDVASEINPKSFINCNNYKNLDEVVERVIEIDNNDELFKSILSEPIFLSEKIPDFFNIKKAEAFLTNICDQPVERASRRCTYTWRGRYIKDLKETSEIINKCKNPLVKTALKLSK